MKLTTRTIFEIYSQLTSDLQEQTSSIQCGYILTVTFSCLGLWRFLFPLSVVQLETRLRNLLFQKIHTMEFHASAGTRVLTRPSAHKLCCQFWTQGEKCCMPIWDHALLKGLLLPRNIKQDLAKSSDSQTLLLLKVSTLYRVYTISSQQGTQPWVFALIKNLWQLTESRIKFKSHSDTRIWNRVRKRTS